MNYFGTFEKWKPVREVLDLDDEGESIFGRKKPLVEKKVRFKNGTLRPARATETRKPL